MLYINFSFFDLKHFFSTPIKFVKRATYLFAILFILMTTGCGSSRMQIATTPASEAQSGRVEINPRVETLMIRGSVAELVGDYRNALEAYQEARVYAPNAPALFLAIAQVYQKMNRFDTAMEMLKQGAAIDSSHIELLENLAFLYELKQENEAAIRTYKRLISITQVDIDYRVRLASLYLRSDENEKAIAEFEHIVKLGYATPDIWRPLGLLYVQEQRFDEAMQTLQSWIKESPDEEQGYIDVGEVFKAQNDKDGLIEWFEKTLDAHPEFEVVRSELQQLFLEAGDMNAATALYEQAVARDSSAVTSIGQLALLYLEAGDTLSAKKMLAKLERSDLADPGQVGFLYLQAGDTLKAETLFEQIIEQRPDDWRSYYNRGQLSYFGSKWLDTIKYLSKAVEVNPKEPALWLMLSETYIRIDSLESAERSLRNALELAPDNKDANYMLGFILYQQQRADESVPYFEKAIEVDGNDFRAMGILASIYDGKGNYTISDSLYERALRLSPKNSVFNNNYGYSLSERGIRLEYANELVDRALEVEPENGSYLDTKGWVLYQLGDYQGALEYIQQSLQVRDSSAEVWEHLGDVHEKLGQYEEAIRAWRKAYQIDGTRKTLLEKLEQLENKPE